MKKTFLLYRQRASVGNSTDYGICCADAATKLLDLPSRCGDIDDYIAEARYVAMRCDDQDIKALERSRGSLEHGFSRWAKLCSARP